MCQGCHVYFLPFAKQNKTEVWSRFQNWVKLRFELKRSQSTQWLGVVVSLAMFFIDSLESFFNLTLQKVFFTGVFLDLILQEVFRYSKPCFSCCSDLVAQNAAPSLLHNMSSKTSSAAPVPLSGLLYWLPGPSLRSSSIYQFYLIGFFFSPSFLIFRTGGNKDKINSYFPPRNVC